MVWGVSSEGEPLSRNSDRKGFTVAQRVVLLEQDEDRADERYDAIREALKWYTRTAVGILVAIVGSCVLLYLQARGGG